MAKKTYLRILKNDGVMRKYLLLFFCCLLLQDCAISKQIKPVATIPFEMVGTYVVIKVKVNNSPSLNLILDSGIRNTLITELMPGDNITLNYSDVKELMGLGGGDHLEAYTSSCNSLNIGKIKLESKTVFVLKEDVFNLSKHTGYKLNGLVGVDFFQDYVIEINYNTNRVKFYDSKTFTDPLGYEKLPISIEWEKMFINLIVQEADSTKRKMNMLIDTGAELAAWFQTFKSNSFKMPENGVRATIGQGLNGEIVGKINRLQSICFGKYCLENPIVAFPDSSCINQIIDKSDRDGTVGSQLLSRFNSFIDYQNKQFYFKPNANFDKTFGYNIAGIEVTQILPFIPQTEVWMVWEDSPAEAAGIKVGDQILEINGEKAFNMTVNELKKIFETLANKPLKITVLRDKTQLKFEIEMKSKI